MACPLCGDGRSRRSWLGSTRFRDREFTYHACAGCGSLFCVPMPDADTLQAMYGPAYASVGGDDASLEDPKAPQRVLDWLRDRAAGTFLDYGCGKGELLTGALALGWKAIGVELDPEVARQVAARTGATVLSSLDQAVSDGFQADVVNLGDVIEHLTDPLPEVRRILRLLRPGGLFIAQGPLEANFNLFTLGLRAARTLRPRPSSFPPYHVTLATARGQRQFFDALGLQRLAFDVSEVDWPAPSRLRPGDLRNARKVALRSIRLLSRAATRLSQRGWGNRYFYVGRRSAAPGPLG